MGEEMSGPKKPVTKTGRTKSGRDNTAASFRDKWTYNQKLAFAETSREDSEIFQWILNRNGFANPQTFREYLGKKVRILDAGCGNGRVTALLRRYSNPEKTKVLGIDLVAIDIARKNLKGAVNVNFLRKNILGPLGSLGKFDFIYCQEVLHHTKDPKKGFLNLCGLLAEGGEIAIYVYKKKAPIRELTDEYIRKRISSLPYKKAMKICDQITELGRVLSDCQHKIKIPRVDILEIQEGEYELQRFIYHFFMKCFWNPTLNFKDNSAINYDWYHPHLSSKHTAEEVQGWFREAGLKMKHLYVDFYGITIRGQA
jgi:SAM-dependent methyltransferase